MKKQILTITLAVLSSIFFISTSLATTSISPVAVMDGLIQVFAGTSVSLELNEEVSSEYYEIGNAIELTVRQNVTVNGKVVVRAGARAEGYISNVIKNCDNCSACKNECSKIVIKVETVQAVDNQMLRVNSKPHTVRGECCGKGPATGKMGTLIRASTLNNERVNA